MKEVRCVKIKLKPNSIGRVREWVSELETRRDEALATLRDESAFLETYFLDSNSDGDFLIVYMRAESFERASEAVKESTHDIDAYHKQFQKATWESGRSLELLLDLERIDELERL